MSHWTTTKSPNEIDGSMDPPDISTFAPCRVAAGSRGRRHPPRRCGQFAAEKIRCGRVNGTVSLGSVGEAHETTPAPSIVEPAEIVRFIDIVSPDGGPWI